MKGDEEMMMEETSGRPSWLMYQSSQDFAAPHCNGAVIQHNVHFGVLHRNVGDGWLGGNAAGCANGKEMGQGRSAYCECMDLGGFRGNVSTFSTTGPISFELGDKLR